MQSSIPWSSSVSLFVIEIMAIIHSVKYIVPFSFAVPLLTLAVTHCRFLSLFVIRCHSLSLIVPLVVIRCHSLYHSLSLIVIRCHLLYHSMSFVVTCCHSMYHSSVFLWTISRRKGIKSRRFGQLIEYNATNIFVQKSCRKWGREISSRPFCFFKKILYKVKGSGWQLSFNIFQ